jgi:subfamily B ATP-binding cassette protein MsbA
MPALHGPAGALAKSSAWGNLNGWPRALRGPLEGFLFGRPPLEALGRMCLLLLVVYLFKNVLDYLASYLMISIEQGVVRDLRNALVRHLHSLPLAFFHGERVGILASRIVNDVQMVRGALAAGISNIIKESLLVLGALFWVFWVSWKLALVSLLILPPVIGIVVWIGRRMRSARARCRRRMADLQAVLHETLANIRVVKAFHTERWESERFARENERFYRSFLRLRRTGEAASPITEYAMVIVAAGVLWYGGQLIFREQSLAPSNFLLFVYALLSMMSPLKKLSGVNSTIQEGLAAGDRIFRLLDTPSTIADAPDARPVPGFAHALRFEDVRFEYGEGGTVLANVDLELKKGETVALVGPSGAGKSTIADLLPRFYDPTGAGSRSTATTCAGSSSRSCAGSSGSCRRRRSCSTTRSRATSPTAATTSAGGDRGRGPGGERARLRRAAAAGYDTDRRARRQAVGRRAPAHRDGARGAQDPAILILDEATSALDSASEAQVQDAIERLRAATALIIAHRLSTIQRADRIVVIDGGRIVEQGRHAELLARGGLYARLHGLQFQTQA